MRMTSKLLAGMVMTLWAGSVMAAEVQQDFKMMGWVCPHCPDKTLKAVKQVEGVQDATADMEKHLLTVKFDDAKTTIAEIKKAIKKAGYACTLKDRGDNQS